MLLTASHRTQSQWALTFFYLFYQAPGGSGLAWVWPDLGAAASLSGVMEAQQPTPVGAHIQTGTDMQFARLSDQLQFNKQS